VEHGMRTMEHLKGFLDDGTLQWGDKDYAAAVDGPEVWNTPTLYANRANLRGAEARAVLDGPQARYVPLRKRLQWSRSIDQLEDDLGPTRREAAVIMKQIVGRLVGVHARFLAGTDADGYPFQVMGFGLVDEIQLLCDAGLSPAAAMRAATSEPARAMRVVDEFGTIRRGMRADLILLEDNPLEHASAFSSNQGVMAHGYWLAHRSLDAALEKLAAIEAEPDAAVEVSPRTGAETFVLARKEVDAGFVFDTMELEELAAALRKAGLAKLAADFEGLAEVPRDGPCAEELPK
jgi:amidohydrolase family protein